MSGYTYNVGDTVTVEGQTGEWKVVNATSQLVDLQQSGNTSLTLTLRGFDGIAMLTRATPLPTKVGAIVGVQLPSGGVYRSYVFYLLGKNSQWYRVEATGATPVKARPVLEALNDNFEIKFDGFYDA